MFQSFINKTHDHCKFNRATLSYKNVVQFLDGSKVESGRAVHFPVMLNNKIYYRPFKVQECVSSVPAAKSNVSAFCTLRGL
jgi:hypothetical protein